MINKEDKKHTMGMIFTKGERKSPVLSADDWKQPI